MLIIEVPNPFHTMKMIKATFTQNSEGFQRATGKPFGRLRRGETLCETGKSKEGLSSAFHKNPSFCDKPYPLQEEGAEGFQRAIGKPFGRACRRETFCVCKNVLHHLQKCKILCQRYEALKAHQKRLEGFSVSGDNMDSGPGRILGIQ